MLQKKGEGHVVVLMWGTEKWFRRPSAMWYSSGHAAGLSSCSCSSWYYDWKWSSCLGSFLYLYALPPEVFCAAQAQSRKTFLATDNLQQVMSPRSVSEGAACVFFKLFQSKYWRNIPLTCSEVVILTWWGWGGSHHLLVLSGWSSSFCCSMLCCKSVSNFPVTLSFAQLPYL